MERQDKGIEIVRSAIDIVAGSKIHANNALMQALTNARATDTLRKRVQAAYGDALLSMRIGCGIDYDKELLRETLKVLGGSPDSEIHNSRVELKTKKKRQKKEEKKMTEMNENENTENVAIEIGGIEPAAGDKPKRTGRSRKYNIGDVYPAVSDFGLMPVGSRDGVEPTVGLQLSFKTKKARERELMVIPQGTQMQYVGVRQMHPDIGSKKMIFVLSAGTQLDDGTSLSTSVEVAGVVSHIVDQTKKSIEQSESAEDADQSEPDRAVA